jgi:amino acid adenylation domain-containing protein
MRCKASGKRTGELMRDENPYDIVIHELFEQQVELTPAAVAVEFQGEELSYLELNKRANQLAHYLRALGVGPDVLVGLCMERSLEMLVALLGILKAGGAYVSLDRTYPGQRLALMLKDTQAPVLLTQQRLVTYLPEHEARVVCLDTDWEMIASQSEVNVRSGAKAENLAYVMYTSGSTGQPKGVCVVHRGIARLVIKTDYVMLSPEEVLLQIFPLSFDASTFEIWGSLLNGGRLVLMPAQTPSIDEIGEAVTHHRVTTLLLTSALFQFLVDDNLESLRGVRQLISGGDVIPIAQAQKALRELRGVRLINGFGPTENTTFTCCYGMTGDLQVNDAVPIGRPISETQVYVLDGALRPVLPGVAGELYIGGDGLARGYLNQPEMTAEKFIPNPFSDQPGTRIYRSGDRVRYLPDGNLEFLGRIDAQVKIRGFRLEPGEIEATLNQHPGVRESVVMAFISPTGDKQLAAYVVENRTPGTLEQRSLEKRLHSERVQQWQKVYDEVIYQDLTQERPVVHDPKFDITGWESSYTDLPLSTKEMQEQVSQTVERILSVRPSRVLEIGCGTGLLLFRLAPYCTRYLGTDFSEVALKHIRDEMARPGQLLPQVTLWQREADDFAGIEAGSFDGVILNSVAQHFPGIKYLLKILEGAIEAIKPGGFIFVGDVRSLPLLKAFHTSVQLCRSPSSLSIEQFRRTVQREMEQEEELIIDPTFFRMLAQHLPQLGQVRIQLKRGRHHNELTRFRYDVLMSVGKETVPAIELESLDWQRQELSLTAVRRFLEDRAPELLALRGVPNARLAEEMKALKLLEDAAQLETVGMLREAVTMTAAGPFIEPEEFWALSESLPYRIEISESSVEKLGCYDVLCKRQTTDTTEASGSADITGATLSSLSSEATRLNWRGWEESANNPLQHTQRRKLVSQLRSYLKEKLPEYMVPAAFVVMDRFPLTAHGKLDRRALTTPEPGRPEMDQAYIAPRTPLDELIADIWQKVLGVERVGIEDNFFELGGDSLKAVQVIARLRRALNVQISTVELFEKTTISALGEMLRTGKSEDDADRKTISSRARGEQRRAKRMVRSPHPAIETTA